MLRSRKGIELLVNLIGISYAAMKILPYKKAGLFRYSSHSAQEVRFAAVSEMIRVQVIFDSFVSTLETSNNLKALFLLLEKQVQRFFRLSY